MYNFSFASILANETDKYDNGLSKIKFEVVEGLIMVKASMNGVGGDYIFDTGTSGVFINKKVNRTNTTFLTVHGEVKSKEMRFKDFKCGAIEKGSMNAWAMNLSFIEDIIDRPVAGIIGANLTQDYKVLIDYELEEIQLIPINQSWLDFSSSQYNITSLPVEITSDNLAVVDITVGHGIKRMIFDTGAGRSVLGTRDEVDQSISNQDIAINRVKIEDVQFSKIDTQTLGEMVGHDINGILSVDALNASKVLIDYKSSKIYLFWAKAELLE